MQYLILVTEDINNGIHIDSFIELDGDESRKALLLSLKKNKEDKGELSKELSNKLAAITALRLRMRVGVTHGWALLVNTEMKLSMEELESWVRSTPKKELRKYIYKGF